LAARYFAPVFRITEAGRLRHQISSQPEFRGADRGNRGFRGRTSVATSRKVLSFFLCCLACWVVAGCGSSKSSTTTTTSGLQFTAPATSPILDLGQQVTLSVNGSVTWSLQSATGFGKAPGSLTNATSASVTYAAPPVGAQPPCSNFSPPAPQQALVVATSTTGSENATMAVTIVQNLPCVATQVVYPACPAPGTVIEPPLFTGQSPDQQLSQVGVYTAIPIYDGGAHETPSQPWGVPPFTWHSGALPSGLSVGPGSDTSNILISGTPVDPGCYPVAFEVTDSNNVTSAPLTYNIVVIPASLKVTVPTYSYAYNYSTGSNPGIPYSPIALSVNGGLGPYAWTQDQNSYLPPGLGLTGIGSSSSSVSITGTPQSGDNGGSNGNGAPGAYPTLVYVSDSQTPYPAFGQASLGGFSDSSLPEFCGYVGPVLPSPTNGGNVNGNSVPGYAYLSGPVVFMLRGFDANGPVVIAGSVNLDGGGNVTGGEEDVTNSAGTQNLTIVPTGSSYTVGILPNTLIGNLPSYNRGCMTLASSGGTSTTFAFTLGGCSNHFTQNNLTSTSASACGMTQTGQQNSAAGQFTTGHIIEFDDSTGQGTRASGILRAQNSSGLSGPSGPYAFGLSGADASAGRYAAAGSFTASSGTLNSVAADTDDAGTLQSAVTGGSGSVSSTDTNGRAAGSLSIGPTTYDLVFYTVSPNEVLMATTDALSAAHPILGGEAITTASSFTTPSVRNSHIFHIGGLSPSGPDVSVGVFAFDGVGGLTGTVYQNQAGTLGTTSISGTYQVDPNSGRVAFQSPGQGQTLGAHTVVAYVIPPASNLTRSDCSTPAACVTGFLVGTDSTAQSGVMDYQTQLIAPPPPFSNRFVAGDYVYGTDETLDRDSANIEGNVTPHPSASSTTSGSFSGAQQDFSSGNPNYCLQPSCLMLVPEQTLSGSYSVNTDGTGTFGGGTASVTNGNVIFWIDESPLNLHPSVVVDEQ
jgi:hypothetical protein